MPLGVAMYAAGKAGAKSKDHRIAELEHEARFLLNRLSELSFDDLEGLTRDFYGHVSPSIARLSDLLEQK